MIEDQGFFKKEGNQNQGGKQGWDFKMQDQNNKEKEQKLRQLDVEKIQIMDGCKRIIKKMQVLSHEKKTYQLSMIINIINIGNNYLQENFPIALNFVSQTKINSLQIPKSNKEYSYSIQYLCDVLYEKEEDLQKQVRYLQYTATLLHHKIAELLTSIQISMKLNQFSKILLSQVENIAKIAKTNFL